MPTRRLLFALPVALIACVDAESCDPGNLVICPDGGVDAVIWVNEDRILVNDDWEAGTTTKNRLSECRRIGGVVLKGKVSTVQSFDNVEEITGGVEVHALKEMTKLDGFPALKTLGGGFLFMEGGEGTSLDEVAGFNALTTVPDFYFTLSGANVISGFQSVETVVSFGKLIAVEGSVTVTYSRIADLDGLGALQTIGGDLRITENRFLPAEIAMLFAQRVDVAGEVTICGNSGDVECRY